MTNLHLSDPPEISVVLPAFNEEMAISSVIQGFADELRRAGKGFEIVVVDNNSSDSTGLIASEKGARVVKETKQGYGYACIRGVSEANGQIVFLTEADNSFSPRDLWKMLSYLEEEDIDAVLGTRTTLELVERGAKMGWLLHWGNFFLAKLIQIQFWNRCRLTDVGCTFKAIKREALLAVQKNFREGGPAFSPEMIIWCLKAGLRTVEIPIRYRRRIGQSKVTSSSWKSIHIGFRMLKLILTQRFWGEISNRDDSSRRSEERIHDMEDLTKRSLQQ